ncbi:MAG: hypothetical protein ACW972_11155, partial [Promethearchaeota archaeon]
MSEQKLFQVFVNKLEFNPDDYLVPSEEQELTNFQKQMIDNATAILKENIVGSLKSFGGSIKANEEKFKELEKRAAEELENEQYEDIKKELKSYVKKLRDLIEKICVVIIPVKEMPWVDVLFRTVPRIIFDKKIELQNIQRTDLNLSLRQRLLIKLFYLQVEESLCLIHL